MLRVEQIETDHQAYAARRAQERRRMIPLRRERRIRLGDLLAVEFENADTLTYQVQEMVYAERLSDPAEVAHEVATYAPLLPGPHQLCATLFIELDDVATARAELARLSGLQHALRLEIGPYVLPAVELRGPEENTDLATETVSVHLLRFVFSDAARDAFRNPAIPAQLVVDHPRYRDDTPIEGSTRRSLLADLALARSH